MSQYCVLVSVLVAADNYLRSSGFRGEVLYGPLFESVVHRGEEGTVGRGVLVELRWLVRWLATVSSAFWLLSVNVTQT